MIDYIRELVFDLDELKIKYEIDDEWEVCIFVNKSIDYVNEKDRKFKSTLPFLSYSLIMNGKLHDIIDYWFVNGGDGKTVVFAKVVYLEKINKRKEYYNTKVHHINYLENISIVTLVRKQSHPMQINVGSYIIEQYLINELYLSSESIKEEDKYE